MSARSWDESLAIQHSFGMVIQLHSTDSGRWYRTGAVVTAYGIVSVYSQEDHTRLDLAHEGRHYMRNFQRGMTERGLAIAATKFARAIVAEGYRP